MNTIKKIIYACLVAVMFIIIIKLSIKTLYKDNYEQITEKSILTTEYLLGIAGVLVGYYVFGSKTFGNTVIEAGLIIGGLILIFLSFVLNWDNIGDGTKLISISTVLLVIMYKSYTLFD